MQVFATDPGQQLASAWESWPCFSVFGVSFGLNVIRLWPCKNLTRQRHRRNVKKSIPIHTSYNHNVHEVQVSEGTAPPAGRQ